MRSSVGRRLAIVAIWCACFGICLGGPVAALGQQASPSASQALPEFGISPRGDFPAGYFDLTLNPGEQVDLSAGVSNSGEMTVALRAFAANVSNPPNGGFAAGAEEEEPIGPSLWVTFTSLSFDLAPDATMDLPFSVAVPKAPHPANTSPRLLCAFRIRLPFPAPTPSTRSFAALSPS